MKRRTLEWKLSRDKNFLIFTFRVDIKKFAVRMLREQGVGFPPGNEPTLDSASFISQREAQALPSVISGRSEKETAAELGISVRGAKFHRSAIYKKFGVDSQRALMMLAKAK